MAIDKPCPEKQMWSGIVGSHRQRWVEILREGTNTANGDIVVLIVMLTLPKIAICLTIRPSSRPFLTVSLQSVGKISQISLRYSLTINTIIKSDQNMGNDLHYLIHINSHLRRTPKVCL